VKVLLDTHVLLWALTKSEKLTKKAASLITDPDNLVLVSAATVWEVAIKKNIGRIEFVPEQLIDYIYKSGYKQLPVTFDHCTVLADLPLHHRDPFDRMLVAQSISEPAVLVTHDKTLAQYNCTVMVV